MSNYPNMSYCMNENTLAAMQQIINAMQEEGVDFIMDMGRDERRAFQELYMACEDFMNRSAVLQEEYEQYEREMDDTVSEQQEWADFDPDC